MSSPSPNIQRGEIWMVKFDPQVGQEIGKVRPAVVINIPTAGRLPLHIVVPITTGSAHFNRYFWMVSIKADATNGLAHDSFADTFQVKSVALERFQRKLGTLTSSQLDLVVASVAFCIGYVSPKS